MAVQFCLQLSDEIILGVQLQLQLIYQTVSLTELLDLQLQRKLQVPQSTHSLDMHTFRKHIAITHRNGE